MFEQSFISITMDTLIKNVSLLCSSNKTFHCKKRERELKSLTKYTNEFKNFSYEEFVNFICRHYVHSLDKKKRFSSQSIYNRISAIQNRFELNLITKKRFDIILKNLRKIFNPYNLESELYTNTGDVISLPQVVRLRQNAKFLIEENCTSVADKWILNTYTDEEIEILYTYFKRNLVNFLSNMNGGISKFDIPFIELCMIIVFCYNTPRRIAEIINLRIKQVEELLLHNTLNIKSKDGFSIDCIYISAGLAEILNSYINKMYPGILESNEQIDCEKKVFNSTYKMYYSRMRNVLKTLIGESRLKNLRLFHGFRNYFANKHLSSTQECTRILGHRNVSMTRKYAQGHRQTNESEKLKKNNVLDYLNTV